MHLKRQRFHRAMARYVLDIVDPSKRKLFDQLIKELDFVEVVNIFKSGKKAQVALEVMEALDDVKAHIAGRKKLKSARQLLNELEVRYAPVFERAIKRLAKKYPSVRDDLAVLISGVERGPSQWHTARQGLL